MKKFILILMTSLLFLGCSSSSVDSVSIEMSSWGHEGDQTNSCSYSIQLPIIQAGTISPELAISINTQITDYVLTNFLLGYGAYPGESIEEGTAQFLADCQADIALNLPAGSAWFATITSEVTQNQDGILSLFIYWEDFRGGAHPNRGGEGLIFDLVTGKQLLITDLIRSDHLEDFQTLLRDKIVEEVENPEIISADMYSKDFLSEYGSVYLEPDNLTVVYSPYEIMPGNRDVERITFSREELADLLIFD